MLHLAAEEVVHRGSLVEVARGDLIPVAHHQDRHLLRVEVLAGHPLEILPRHGIDLAAERLPEILRPGGPLVVDEHPQHLRLALELPGKRLDQPTLRRLELILRHQLIANLADLVHHDLRRQGDRGVLALEARAEIAGIRHPWRDRRADRIGESLVAPHLLHQAAGEAAGPENLVEQKERDRVGIIPLDRPAAEHHLALRNLLGHVIQAGLERRRRLHGIGGHAAPLPARERLLQLREHLLRLEVARHRDDRVAGAEDPAMHLRESVAGDGLHARAGRLRRFEVIGAVDEPLPFARQDR